MIVRFISYHRNGLGNPPTRIVLGHGYKSKGGESHRYLCNEIYPKGEKDEIYAGYLKSNEGVITVHEGGSASLFIVRSKETNALLEKVFGDSTVNKKLGHLFPLIADDKVPHILLAL